MTDYIIEYRLDINFTRILYSQKKFELSKSYHPVVAKTMSQIAIKKSNWLDEQLEILFRENYKTDSNSHYKLGKYVVNLSNYTDWKQGHAILYIPAEKVKKSDNAMFKHLHKLIMKKVQKEFGMWFSSGFDDFNIDEQEIEITGALQQKERADND